MQIATNTVVHASTSGRCQKLVRTNLAATEMNKSPHRTSVDVSVRAEVAAEVPATATT
jgi:hypothetical protein